MTLGCPVVCSNAASLAEIVADGGVLCAPHDVTAMSAAMQRIMHEPAFAASLRQQGRRRAASFSWAVTARQTLAVYLKAVGLAK